MAQMYCNIIVDLRNKPLSQQMEAFIYFLLQLSEVSFPGPFNESF